MTCGSVESPCFFLEASIKQVSHKRKHLLEGGPSLAGHGVLNLSFLFLCKVQIIYVFWVSSFYCCLEQNI